MIFDCLLSASSCNILLKTGSILSISISLQIAGVIFAALQFLDTNKLRGYIFRFGFLKSLFAWLNITALTLIVFSQIILPLIPGEPFLFFGYPFFYEIVSSILFTLVFLLFMTFLLIPKVFLPKYSRKLMTNIAHEITSIDDRDSLYGLTAIIHFVIEDIIKKGSVIDRYTDYSDKKVSRKYIDNFLCLEVFNIYLSNQNFINYIAENNAWIITDIIEYADKYNLHESGDGRQFFNALGEALFTNSNSLLVKELSYSGVLGISQTLSNTIFKSKVTLSQYNIFHTFRAYNPNINNFTLEIWKKGLKIAVEEYYLTGGDEEIARSLSGSIKSITDTVQSLSYEIYELKNKGLWKNEYGSKISKILSFFQEVTNSMSPRQKTNYQDEYTPIFSKKEMNCDEGTVSGGIAESLFNCIDHLTILNAKEYARTELVSYLYGFIFAEESSEPIFKAIANKVWTKIEMRVKENLQGRYASMIEVIIRLYNFNDRNIIINAKFMELFRSEIFPKMISDKNFSKKHLPKIYKITDSMDSIVNKNGTLVFQK